MNRVTRQKAQTQFSRFEGCLIALVNYVIFKVLHLLIHITLLQQNMAVYLKRDFLSRSSAFSHGAVRTLGRRRVPCNSALHHHNILTSSLR